MTKYCLSLFIYYFNYTDFLPYFVDYLDGKMCIDIYSINRNHNVQPSSSNTSISIRTLSLQTLTHLLNGDKNIKCFCTPVVHLCLRLKTILMTHLMNRVKLTRPSLVIMKPFHMKIHPEFIFFKYVSNPQLPKLLLFKCFILNRFPILNI